MKISLKWLQEYVSVDMPPADLADALTMMGLEVESVADRYGYLDTVVVGRITEITPHPESAGLKICRVDTGAQSRTVVCGAPNATIGLMAPMALPGTVMPDGTRLETRMVRNQVSEGMLCSAGELGLGADRSGLMALPGSTPAGTPLAAALGLADAILEVELTPNRADCLSVMGIAREVAAICKQPLRYPKTEIPSKRNEISDHAAVTIQAPRLCPRYAARLLFDVTVGPSPLWLQDRLMSVGLRPINNIVDVTNFVMLETGQPLHAFDFDRLDENRIIVREAVSGETFVTLDQKERSLSPGMLLICDGRKPVALAGVMGGMNSEIQPDTRRVLIESACFDPGSIRTTAKRLGLNTDASHRFERGVDPAGTVSALNRAALMMAELAGGRIAEGVIDAHPGQREPLVIHLDVRRTNRLLGLNLRPQEMADLLRSIEFKITGEDADTLTVMPPSFRVDVFRPEDLAEEIARLSGYNNIPTTFPPMLTGKRKTDAMIAVRDRIRRVMLGFGFYEAINYSFVSPRACDNLRLVADDPRRSVVSILNPLTEEQSVLRTSLLPGLLETMQRNNARQVGSAKLFETGKIFIHTAPNQQPVETEMLAGLWTGLRSRFSWHDKEQPCDFYDIKGVLEGLGDSLGIPGLVFATIPADACRYTRPGVGAAVSVAGEAIGIIGETHPDVLANFGLKQTAFFFEISLPVLARHIPTAKNSRQLPKYPSVSRDLTLIIDKRIAAVDILSKIESAEQQLVEDIILFDVYEGRPIPDDKKSISIRLVYRSAEMTLEDDLVNRVHGDITRNLLAAFHAALPA
ncbi:MAG: phenylalanine--tRNA ligase subunit beta [Thermodesulfobacteriota bacterium]